MKRNKTKVVSVYIDQKYADKLAFIKNTVGITRFVEKALDAFQIDENKLEALKTLAKI